MDNNKSKDQDKKFSQPDDASENELPNDYEDDQFINYDEDDEENVERKYWEQYFDNEDEHYWQKERKKMKKKGKFKRGYE